MYSHPIKKLFGLLTLYALIIVGIFVLQFRSESVFSDSIGFLHFTLAKTETDKSASAAPKTVLRNSLQADFKGLTIYFDENNPASVHTTKSDSVKNITLLSWNKASPLECTFSFSDNVSLSFSVTSLDSNADMTIQADLPSSISSVTLHYKAARSYNITSAAGSQVQIADKKSKYILNAAHIEGDTISLSNRHALAAYSAVKEKKGFSFEMTASMALADPTVFQQNIKKMESNILSLFSQTVQSNGLLTEQSVVSYVAIMAKNGQYNTALDSVPDSFKRGQKRTYLSAPYFNTLEQMYSTLAMQLSNTMQLIKQAISSGSCDIFTVSDLSDYIMQNKKINQFRHRHRNI